VKKIIKIIVAIVLIIIFVGILFSGYFLPPNYSPTIVVINLGLNKYYHYQWPIIKEQGNSTINKIVNDTAQYGTDPIRLTKIADKISENFTDIYWPSQRNGTFFCYNNIGNEKYEWAWCAPFWGIFGSDPHAYGYVFDRKGRIRSLLPNDLNYDPRWIAYQKTGACEALSIYFNETANRSGFVSRIVTSPGANHMWNEVLINGEWKYYDIQLYGQVKNSNESSSWFGDRTDYGNKSGFNRSDITKDGVFVFNLQTHKNGMPITQSYIS
jgi:hypothetical protein